MGHGIVQQKAKVFSFISSNVGRPDKASDNMTRINIAFSEEEGYFVS